MAKRALAFLFIFSQAAHAEYCATHELNCKHLANILLTPNGVEKLLKEQLDVSLLNKEAHSKIKSKLQKQPSVVLFESKSINCEKELSPVQMTEKMTGSGLEGCVYYPVMEQVGSEVKIAKHVLFRVRLDNFDAKKTKFDVNNVACLTAQSCQAKVSAKQISAVGQLIIETLDGVQLEKPRIELANKSGKTPVSTQFNLALKPNGEIISALGSFDKIDLQLENTEFKSAVMDKNGKLLNKNEVQDLQIATAKKKREELFQSRFKNGNDATLAAEVAKFNEQQRIKGLKEIPLSVFQSAIANQKKTGKEYPEIFNQLPSFQGASENGAVGAKGFSAPITESLFNDQLEVINNTFATNPKVQSMVKAELNEGLKQAEKGVNQMLAQVSGELGRTFIQMHELPVADVANLIRLNSIEDVIAENTEMLLKADLNSADKLEIQSQNTKLNNEAKALTEKLKAGKSLAITTKPFFDRISDMSRIGLFAGGESCPAPTQILKQGVTDKSQLNGAEFGFELSMESLQSYVDEVYKKSQNESVCMGSIEIDCKGGKKIKLNKKPQIILTKDGKYRMQMNGIDLGSKLSATIGISVDLNIGECKASTGNTKPICMSFANPSVDEKSTAVKFHDSFSWFVKTSDQQVKEGFAATSEINLSKLLPESVSSSFDVQNPKIMGPQGMLVFPMNLRPKDQRILLGKIN